MCQERRESQNFGNRWAKREIPNRKSQLRTFRKLAAGQYVKAVGAKHLHIVINKNRKRTETAYMKQFNSSTFKMNFILK